MPLHHHDARATGEVCGDCGHRFEPAEVRAIGHRVNLGAYVICASCSPVSEQEVEGECYGCGAPLAEWPPFTVSDAGDHHPACSERCRQRVYKRVQRRGRVWAGDRECAHCGASLDHLQVSARFCSGKCRVAAHRANAVTGVTG